MKKTTLIVFTLFIAFQTKAQVGTYEYIDLKRSGWPHIAFEENGQRIARIQGVDGHFAITSVNGANRYFNLNSSNGRIGVGIVPDNNIFHIYGNSQRLLKLENNLDFDAGIEFKSNLANFKIGAGIGSASNSFVIYDLATSSSRLSINSLGNVGLGTSSAASKLEVNGDISLARIHKIKFLETVNGGSRAYIRSTNGEGGDYNSLIFAIAVGTESMIIKHNGRVGIGTLDPKSKLSVNGQIRATEVKVLADISVPDYVFESDYNLRTLQETKEYITANKHLPEIPSAAEIGENGIDLGDMNMRLLKKIEELTLYQIELLERLESVEATNEQMKKQLLEMASAEK